MRKLFLLLSAFIVTNIIHAQTGNNSITGTVINADSKAPLEYATVTIFIIDQTKPLTGTTTDNTGSFTLPEIPAGQFTLVIENIGYSTYTKKDLVIDKKNAIINLKNIALVQKKETLQEVVVSSKTKLIENKIDKMVFNAEKDVSSQGGSATDLLKKVPQVSVDADGNVQLSGSSGIRFLINGKPSSAFGSNIADVLQSIPASQIKSIEVITSPGAKYDAQGLGGIINIILKKNNTRGYNGNLSLSAGTRQENGSLNLNVRKGNFGANAFVSGNKRLPSNSSSDNLRETMDGNTVSTLHQVNSSRFIRQGMQTGTGFDWTYKKYNSLTGNISFNFFKFSGSGNTDQVLQPDKNGIAPDVVTKFNSSNTFRFHNADASLNYKRTFKKEDQELEVSFNTSKGKDLTDAYNSQRLQPVDSLFYGTNSNNEATLSQSQIGIDYAQPLSEKVKLGFGTKASFDNVESNSNVLSYQPTSKNYLPDAFLSNGLNYRQKVYAGYAELTFPVAKLFDAKVGGRYERTVVNAWYSNAGNVNIPSYNTFVPSVFLSKKIGEKQTVKLSVSRRINRPEYDDLNPFVNTNDPKNLYTGNPYLKPEIGYRYEVGYMRDLGKQGSISINLFRRISNNDIQPYIRYYPSYTVGDSVYTNVSVSSRENIGREENTGLNIFSDVHINAKFNVRGNVFLFYRHIINAIDIGATSNSFNYRFNLNTTYQINNTLVAELFGNFNGPRNEAQGRYPSFTSYTFAMRKQFWNKKGSLALTASNPFKENLEQKTLLRGPNFTVNGERKIPFRSIGINFTWKFGKLEFKNEKGDAENNNMAPVQ